MPTKKAKVALVLALALLAALLAVGVASAAPGDTDPTLRASAELRRTVEPASILVHERRFQQIANDTEEGTRASGTRGYAASARYVARKLRDAGYEVSVQRSSSSRSSRSSNLRPSRAPTWFPPRSTRMAPTSPSWTTRAVER